MDHDESKRKSSGHTALMIACKTGNIAAVREILKWRDYGEGVDISARDENGQTALSLAKQLNNAEIIAMFEKYLFLKAVESDDIDAVKTYLSTKESNFEVLYLRSESDILADHHKRNKFKAGIEARVTQKDSFSRSVWLEAIALAQNKRHDRMLYLLLNDDCFIKGFNEDGQTILHQVVAEYLEAEIFLPKIQALEILLISGKFDANVSNLHNETIFEIVCKITPKPNYIRQKIDDLLRIFLDCRIDLNGRNQNRETFLMLACENRRFDIVRSLFKLASREFLLDVDAVDNSGETALIKAKRNNDAKIVTALLGKKLLSAIEDENKDVVKFILAEFRNTLVIFEKLWSSNQAHYESLEERETKFGLWLEAMHMAMKNESKHSEGILKLLLDYGIFGQGIETGCSLFNKLVHGSEVDDANRLPLIELLLKSGKFNVNDRDEYGRTALHWTKEENLISLLIRYGADVNSKDDEGKTPLMPMAINWRIRRIPAIRTLLEAAETLVNLDTRDCNGRTALMHAVMLHRSQDVELLLSKGASINLYDHRGFTALHHSLYGNIDEHFKFPRNSEELKTLKELVVLFDTDKHEHHIWRNEEWNEERSKIIEILLQRPDIDANLLSIEMFSPLDIAEVQISEIPLSTKDALKEKGAVLNVFRQTESDSTSDFHLDFTCKWTLKQLVETKSALKAENLSFLKERWLALIQTFTEEEVSDKDQQGRTALHLMAIFSNCLLTDNQRINDLANTIVDRLISLGCSVNEPDIFGRTPLHYANRVLWKSLISKGADASIKDKDGNIAIDKAPRYNPSKISDVLREVEDRNDETYLLRLNNNRKMEINVQCVDDSVPERCQKEENLKTVPRLLWTECEYACRHPLLEKIKKDVRSVMKAIAKEIERLDPRFAIRPELVGSSNEGTRLGKPDEFDFCFVLTKISELCEVSQSPELPTGFVRLKRKPIKVDETSDFDSFFGNDGILYTVKLNWQFSTILMNALSNIDKQLNSEWILELPFHDIFNNSKKVLNIKMINPLNFITIDAISVDIVPCIHVDGWWPDEAISNVSDEMKKFGCNLVFDGPQELYPWVPYSESCARISFSKAESDMIKHSCDSAKEAYMIGKTIIKKRIGVSEYILKNSVLYCIEALTPSPEKASQLCLSLEEMKSKFHQMDRYLWLKCLLKCHLEFVSRDFCPCYFLPNFSSPIEKEHLSKSSLDWITQSDPSFPLLCKNVYAFYRCTSNAISECCCQLPGPDPLWERFDRNQLIAGLFEIAYN